MKSTDRAILIGVAVLGLVAAFWFLILAPKRQDAADLQTQVDEAQVQVTEAELAAGAGHQAKAEFATNYSDLVTLGKAVPVDADTPSLLTQLQTLSERSAINFQSITLGGGAAAAVAAAPVDPAAASEATAALLPIGATVGTAGLPVMPYEMEFDGGFFEIADFFGRIDGMVQSDGEKTKVDGRLLTIDGFSFSPGSDGLPNLTASVSVTSYLTPADQGITAGATPSGPASATALPAGTAPVDASPDPAISPAVVAN